MKFATPTQVLAMTLGGALALFGLDFWKNPHLWNQLPPKAANVSEGGVHVHLWVNHLCCTGCLSEVTNALAGIPWLGKPRAQPGLLPEEVANQRDKGLPEYGGYLDVPVLDPGKLDFVMIDRLVRDHGLVPGRMELSGVEHFRLEASVPHICCGMCKAGMDDGFGIAKTLASRGQYTWLDSVTVNKERKLVVAHARFLEPGKTMDVAELISGLTAIGFAPAYVRLLVGEENGAAETPAATAAPLITGASSRE